ncbi:phage virion morphogenesis protein [Escherichia coli]|nr:phage virion morphogenesis protein [Escherichia coli]
MAELQKVDDWLSALLANLEPVARSRMMRQLAQELRRTQQQNIRMQRNPDVGCSAQSDRSCGYCTGGRGAGCLEILATHHRISRWRGGRIQSGGRSHQCCIRTT